MISWGQMKKSCLHASINYTTLSLDYEKCCNKMSINNYVTDDPLKK